MVFKGKKTEVDGINGEKVKQKRFQPFGWFVKMGKVGKIVSVVLLLAIAVLVFRSCSAMGGKDQTEEVLVRSIETYKVAYQQKDERLLYTGGLEAGEQAIVSAKNGGRVANIIVENGVTVAAGQALVQLESSDAKNASTVSSATATKARAAYENAQANFERYKALYEAGGMSKKDFEDVRLGLIIAEADAASAAAGASSASDALANTSVKAPIGGLVANKAVTLGQMLAPGQQIMTIESVGKVAVMINVSQDDISKIAVGMDAEVMIKSLGDRPFQGKIVSVNPAADPATRAFSAKIVVENPDGLLKPGMFSEVSINTGKSQKVIAVPVRAITGEEGLYFVFIVDGDTVARQRVSVGDMMGDLIEVKKGLNEGQVVAATGLSTLKDGDKIKVKK